MSAGSAPLNPAETKVVPSSGGTTGTTLESAHAMVISIAILTVFVVVMTAIAGTGPGAGKFSVGLMLLLLALQGIGHVNPVLSYVTTHKLTP